jgi:4-amino-4-deoxy-L-arabinose transferase-like glycosyltransferase
MSAAEGLGQHAPIPHVWPVRRPRLGKWGGLLVVLTVSALLRTTCFWACCANPARPIVEDSASYIALGRELAAGHSFGRPVLLKDGQDLQWMPELLRTPGYPALLAAARLVAGDALWPILLAQNLLGLALCAGLFFSARHYLGERAGLVVGLLAATDLQAVALSHRILTEILFTALVFVAVVLAARLLEQPTAWKASALGLLLGLAAWTRPTGIALPLVLGGCLMVWAIRRRLGRLALAAALVALVGSGTVGAWVVRNGVVCGDYIFTSVARYNNVAYFACHTLEKAEGITRDEAYQRLCDRMGLSLPEVLHRPLSRQEDQRLRATVRETVAAHVKAFAWTCGTGSANLFFGPDKNILAVLGLPHLSFGVLRPTGPRQAGYLPSALLLVVQSGWLLIVYVLVGRTLYQWVRRRRLPAIVWLGLLTALYILVVSSGPMADPRMRTPAMPLLLLTAGAALMSRREGEGGSGRVELPVQSTKRTQSHTGIPSFPI